jgi:Tetratricopeptide repeat
MLRPPGAHSTSFGPAGQSAPASGAPAPPDSRLDAARGDFLFHFRLGNELLQTNRFIEAKGELERALSLRPFDPKCEDLLGVACFRLGDYVRAIQIFGGLAARFSDEAPLRINLALCFLKTGKPEAARATLDPVVRHDPDHKRAWSYLGLALRELGQIEQAELAFGRGGHAPRGVRASDRPWGTSRAASPLVRDIDEGAPSLAENAFSEIDTGDLRFALASLEPAGPGEGWHTLELGDPSSPPGSALEAPASVLPVSTLRGPAQSLAPALAPGVGKKRLRRFPPSLVPPPGGGVSLHPSGLLLVRVEEASAFAARLDAVRVMGGPSSTHVLHRRTHESETDEVLGGIGGPLVHVAGGAELVLGAKPPRELAVLELDDDLAFVREDVLVGFEMRLGYENGRVGVDADHAGRPSSDGLPVVQLRGSGTVVLELTGKLVGTACVPGRPVLVRREWLLGWQGRLLPRALPAAESPNGQRGLIGFSGEGIVLLCAG